MLESILRNHPLVDGNKRLGWLAVYVFYGISAYDQEAPDNEAYDLVIAVAAGQLAYRASGNQLAQWVKPCSVVPN